jgi:hypothetical protein
MKLILAVILLNDEINEASKWLINIRFNKLILMIIKQNSKQKWFLKTV